MTEDQKNQPVLKVKNLRKHFWSNFFVKKSEILRGLDLEVRRGEIFGFLGPNGAGKTTTIKIIMGLMKPDAGEVELFGKPLGDHKARTRTGFLPEQPYFYEYLDVEEVLVFTAELFPMSRKEAKNNIENAISLLALEKMRKTQIRKLSKGWQQRVGLAQAIVNDPELLILDEPMSGLDPMGRREVRELILSLKQKGKTIFFSSHILSDAEMLCDRITVIANGERRYTGTMEMFSQGGASFVDVVTEGIGINVLVKSKNTIEKIAERDGKLFLRLSSQDNVQEILKLAIEAGGKVISITPGRTSLEEIFERAVGGDRGEDG